MRFAREKPKQPAWERLDRLGFNLRPGDLVLSDDDKIYLVDDDRHIVDIETGERTSISDAYGEFQVVTELYEIRKIP